MKRIFLFIILCIFSKFSFAQTGPAGIGNASSNLLWLDAGTLGLSDNDPISSWTDLSGNNNDADQVSASFQPTFKSGQINGLPAIEFDGSNDRLILSSNITTSATSTFVVYKGTANSTRAVLTLDKHLIFSAGSNASATYVNPQVFYPITKSLNSFSIFSLHTASGLSGENLRLINNSNSVNYTRNELLSKGVSSIGSRVDGSLTHGLFFEGQIAEIIVFNTELNSSQRKILNSSLGTKYNFSSPLYAYGSTHGKEVIGIGSESDGSNTSARGRDSILISNASSLDNSDYLLIGNDNGGFGVSTSVPVGITERWNQVWRVDKTGAPGTITIEFFIGSSGFASPLNYALLIEDGDGDFSNGGTTIHTTGKSYNAVNNSISFTDVDLPDGSYFTLAELSTASSITSVGDGLWKNTASWDCGCVPDGEDNVVIDNAHDISIDSNASVSNLTISSGGSLSFLGSDTLSVYDTLLISSTFTSGTGTIAALNPIGTQYFQNSSGSSAELYNLYVANSNGLNIESGDWGLSNNLQVSSGGLDVSTANSFILRSTPSSTSQILESMSNAFSGDFTIQRYISARNADWANMSSPVSNATLADWDEDLILSGVGGDDGNAVSNGVTFRSVKIFNRTTDAFQNIEATSYPLTRGIGFFVYLSNGGGSFDGDTIDVVGTPNSGMIDLVWVNNGFNLVGNPYHSFIEYDSIEKNALLPNSYYIFNTDNGSYDFFDGVGKPAIAPGQAFWIDNPAAGERTINFYESGKVNSNSSSFLRKKRQQNLNLEISSTLNPFRHKMEVRMNSSSTSNIDENDATYLPSIQEGAPGIYSKAQNSDRKLIVNSLNNFENRHSIPIIIDASISGEYQVKISNLETIYSDYSCAFLKDKKTEELIDISVENNYSFYTKEGKEDRFELILSNSYDDCTLANAPNNINKETISLRNAYGTWYVDFSLKEGDLTNFDIRIFNLVGQEVRSLASFSASLSGTHPLHGLDGLNGVYIIQVKSNNHIMNQTVKF